MIGGIFVLLTSNERDIFQHLVNEKNGRRDPQYRLPFLPVQRGDLEQGLCAGQSVRQHRDDGKDGLNTELTLRKGT